MLWLIISFFPPQTALADANERIRKCLAGPLEAISAKAKRGSRRKTSHISAEGRIVDLDPNQTLMSQLPRPRDIPFIDEHTQFIRNHPETTSFPLLDGEGKFLKFTLHDFNDGAHYGEVEQSQYLSKVVQAIYPKAKIKIKRDPEGIYLVVEDNLEDQAMNLEDGLYNARQRRNHLVDMRVMKPANGAAAMLDRASIREAMGLSSEHRVVSIYSSDPVVYLQDLIGDSVLGTDPDVIFFSGKYQFEKMRGLNGLDQKYKEKFEVLRMSGIKPGELAAIIDQAKNQEKRVLVLNDTVGMMSYVHGSADVALVQGPINMFESMNVGTPTVIYHRSDDLDPYHAAFSEMRDTALATGYAHHAENFFEVADAMKRLANQGSIPKESRPYRYKPENRQDDPTGRMLRILKQKIEAQDPAKEAERNAWAASQKKVKKDDPFPLAKGTDKILKIEVTSTLSTSGYDNLGVYQVRSRRFPDETLIAKVPTYQQDFKRILDNNRRLASILGDKAVEVVGQAELSQGRAIVMKVAGDMDSKNPTSINRINQRTFQEAERALNTLLDNGVLPLDFQFMVAKDGSIKVFDADLYETQDTLKWHAPLHGQVSTSTRSSAERLLGKLQNPDSADAVVGDEVYSLLSPEQKKEVDRLRQILLDRGRKMLEETKPEREYR